MNDHDTITQALTMMEEQGVCGDYYESVAVMLLDSLPLEQASKIFEQLVTLQESTLT